MQVIISAIKFRNEPYVLHPVVVKVSPLLGCPLLVFSYVLLTSPILMRRK